MFYQIHHMASSEYFQREEGMDFPIHLGVTEAGDGIEGRVKSAVGIGALLADGVGDTIRVSLTEDPEKQTLPGSKAAFRLLGSDGEAPFTLLGSVPSPRPLTLFLAPLTCTHTQDLCC